MIPVETISTKYLDDYVGRQDVVLIDLRSHEEYLAGHVKTARNIPYEDFEEGDFFLSKDRMIVLYCDRGGASLMAARKLARKGYRVKSVIGGFRLYNGRNLVISDDT